MARGEWAPSEPTRAGDRDKGLGESTLDLEAGSNAPAGVASSRGVDWGCEHVGPRRVPSASGEPARGPSLGPGPPKLQAGRAGQAGGAPACPALGSPLGSPPLCLPCRAAHSASRPDFGWSRPNAAAATESGAQALDRRPDPTPHSWCGMCGSGCPPPGPTRPRGVRAAAAIAGRGRRETRGRAGSQFT